MPIGKNYGSTEDSSDYFPVFDPQANRATMVKMPVRDPDMAIEQERHHGAVDLLG